MKAIICPLWAQIPVHALFVALQAGGPSLLGLDLSQRLVFNMVIGSIQGGLGIKVSNNMTILPNMSVGIGMLIHTLFVVLQMTIPTLPQFMYMTTTHQTAVIAAFTSVQGFFGVAVNHGSQEKKP